MEAVKRLLSTSSVNINSRADVSVHWIAIHIVLFFQTMSLGREKKVRWLVLESTNIRHRGPEVLALEHGFLSCVAYSVSLVARNLLNTVHPRMNSTHAVNRP